SEAIRPDLVLMDIHMPGIGALQAVKAIKLAQPSEKIVIVPVSDDPSHLFEAIKKGAHGYLLKNLNPSAWRDYLRAIAYDEAPLNSDLALSILREFANRKSLPAQADAKAEGLTPRETELLREVARGKTNREVA